LLCSKPAAIASDATSTRIQIFRRPIGWGQRRKEPT
jgi:hypothetical protein